MRRTLSSFYRSESKSSERSLAGKYVTERGREGEVDCLGRHQFQFSYESAAKSVTRCGKAPVFRMRRAGNAQK